MTLRYNHLGQPIGLDWSVCNDGNPQPHIWSDWRAPRANGKPRKPIMNPGSGQGSNSRLPVEVEEKMIEMYVEQELPATVIAKEFGSTFKTVYRVLKRNNVTPRTKSRSQELRHARSNHE